MRIQRLSMYGSWCLRVLPACVRARPVACVLRAGVLLVALLVAAAITFLGYAMHVTYAMPGLGVFAFALAGALGVAVAFALVAWAEMAAAVQAGVRWWRRMRLRRGCSIDDAPS